MNEYLKNLIREKHSQNTGKDIELGDIDFLLYNSRSSEILFVFIKNDKNPVYLFKITNDIEACNRLLNGYETLKIITGLENTFINQTIPRPIYICDYLGHKILLETIVKGRPLKLFIGKNINSADKTGMIFSLAANWLSELQNKLSSKLCSLSDPLVEINILNTMDLYEKKIGFPNKQKEQVISLLNNYRNSKERIPLVVQHHDFGVDNIFYDEKEKKISVFDWEYTNLNGFPLIDLLYFFITYKSKIRSFQKAIKMGTNYRFFSKNIYEYIPNGNDFIEIFYEDNRFSRLVNNAIDEYCSKIGLQREILPFLFLLFILRNMYIDKNALQIFFEKGNPLFC